jgi:hypothetical protein
LIVPRVCGHRVFGAKNDVMAPVWAIPRRIRRTKKSDSRRAECDGKMQRTGIAADDAARVAQKSHELAERTIVSDGVSIPTGRFDGSKQILFTGAII